jgi:hypothetical protein
MEEPPDFQKLREGGRGGRGGREALRGKGGHLFCANSEDANVVHDGMRVRCAALAVSKSPCGGNLACAGILLETRSEGGLDGGGLITQGGGHWNQRGPKETRGRGKRYADFPPHPIPKSGEAKGGKVTRLEER